MDLNPYQPPLLDETITPQRLARPVRIENRFVDAFVAGWWLIRSNALQMLIVLLVVWLPIQAFFAYQHVFVLKPNDVIGQLRLAVLLQGLLGVIGTGAVVALGAGCWQTGQPISLVEAFSASFAQWGRMVLGTFVMMILILIGLVLLVLPGLLMAICFSYLYPVYIIERPDVSTGLQRCAEITRRHFWLSLGLLVVTAVISWAGGLAEGLASYALEPYAAELAKEPTALWLTNTVLGLPTYYIAASTWLFPTAALLRIREEEGVSAPATAEKFTDTASTWHK